MQQRANQPVTRAEFEEILDKKLEEKLDKKLEEKLEEKLNQKLKPYVTQDYLEDRLELFEKGIINAVDEKIQLAISGAVTDILQGVNKQIKSIMEPLGLTIAHHEQRIIHLEQNLQS